MSLDTNMSLCLSFQPNSVAAQGRTGLIAGGFSMPACQPLSATMLRADLAGFAGGMGMGGVYLPDGKNMAIISTMQLTDQPQRHYQVEGWNTGERFINRINKGKHYSRPDGLPLSPPPKRKARREKWRGEAAS